MAVISALVSVAEFGRRPRPPGGVRQELHHGNTKIQKRLVSFLEIAVNPAEFAVDKEFPFRPSPEYEVWIADVALYSVVPWERTADDDYFRGVPTIVIEVLSPSNSASEMLDREETCLRYGGQEFWLIDAQRESVKVIRAGGYFSTHDVESTIESAALGGSIAVRDIFAR